MIRFLTLFLAGLLLLPAAGLAADSEEAMMQQLQKQIQDLSEELDELTDRLEKNERHTALDRIELTGDMRHKVDSLHYKDVTFNPAINVDFQDFFEKLAPATAPGGTGPLGGFVAFNPMAPDSGMDGMADLDPALNPSALDNMFANLYNTNPGLYQSLFTNFQNWAAGGMMGAGVGPFPLIVAPQTSDIDNDILQTSRLRLNMNANPWDNVKFSGRLTMYKNWGDSTGSKVFDSWNSFTMDGTNTGNTTGDLLHVDRAYFDWSNIADSGFYLSIGRRPSTYGPPTQYRENELRGGTPTGNVMNLNFDGITIGRHLEDLTGIEGMVARFCYGQGFESEWGNGELFNNIQTKDTHFAGFNIDFWNDGVNFLQATLFHVKDLNDGFKGIIAFPTEFGALFAPTLYNDMQKFPNFNFVTRVQPSTPIGDMNLAGLVFAREEFNGINWFVSGGWTQLRPNGEAGMFGGLGTDAVFQPKLNTTGTEVIMEPVAASESKNEDGYGVYVGVQFPAPKGKLGLEYNYGSKYYTPFTQNVDDVIGSKLGTRGHAGEVYYIVDINPRMFLKFGGIYYDYEYTGSGTPVGEPKKVEDVQNGTAYSFLPVIDKAYDLNASVTVKF